MESSSRFLPSDFDPSRPIAVVAGQRDYPKLMVNRMRELELPVRLLALDGETDEELIKAFTSDTCTTIKVGQIGHLLKVVREWNTGYVVFVGQVSPGKLFKDLRPDLKAISLLASLKERNAHTIYGAIVDEIRKVGVQMLDARAFMDDHVAWEGLMTGGKLKANPEYVEHGIEIAKQVSALDIGQSIVVRKGTVLAVEAFEGTDDMLRRANKYRTDQLIFVKATKPNQNPYFDWPVFGETTLESMAFSGIQTAALEAERTVMLHRNELISRARKLGIEIYGYRTKPGNGRP